MAAKDLPKRTEVPLSELAELLELDGTIEDLWRRVGLVEDFVVIDYYPREEDQDTE